MHYFKQDRYAFKQSKPKDVQRAIAELSMEVSEDDMTFELMQALLFSVARAFLHGFAKSDISSGA